MVAQLRQYMLDSRGSLLPTEREREREDTDIACFVPSRIRGDSGGTTITIRACRLSHALVTMIHLYDSSPSAYGVSLSLVDQTRSGWKGVVDVDIMSHR